jgi:hypothetical protein
VGSGDRIEVVKKEVPWIDVGGIETFSIPLPNPNSVEFAVLNILGAVNILGTAGTAELDARPEKDEV